jgi:hypothetical protein
MKRVILVVLMAGLAGGLAFAQTEEDFSVTLTRDGQGVIIAKYFGKAAQVVIPAEIQGMPVREIGERAFDVSNTAYSDPRNRPQNINIVIPSGVTTIGAYAFRGQRNLRSVTIPPTVTTIGQQAFGSTGVTSITLPTALTQLSHEAFLDCSDLESITIPDDIQITTIASRTFDRCEKLTSINIPEGITEIGSGAFDSCAALTSVSLPSTISRIVGAFMRCSSLTTVTIPESVAIIDFPRGSGYAFVDCPKLNLASQAALRSRGYDGRF